MSMLLVSHTAVPEVIVELRTSQDVAGVAVGLVGQDKTGFSFLNLDVLVILFDDFAEELGDGIRLRIEQDTAEKFLFLSANTGRGKDAFIGHDSSPFRDDVLLRASEVWEPCYRGNSPRTLPVRRTGIPPRPEAV